MKAKHVPLGDLKQALSLKTKEDLLKEIINLYQIIPAVKEYYSGLMGNPLEVLEQYKSKIEQEFIFYGNTPPKLRFSVARKCINDFKKVCNDGELQAELMFHYCSCLTEFNTEYSVDDENFYSRAEKLFEQSLDLAMKSDVLDKFEYRALGLVENSCDGWGFKDCLSDIYSNYYSKVGIV